MTFIGDSRRSIGPGFLPLRHYNYDNPRVDKNKQELEYRAGVQVIRVREWHTQLGKPVNYEYDETKDVADLDGIVIWPAKKLGPNSNFSRPQPCARFSWPAAMTGADHPWNEHRDGVYPIEWHGQRSLTYDFRFASMRVSYPSDMYAGIMNSLDLNQRTYPGNTTGIVLAASLESSQKPIFFPCGNPLVAVHYGSDPFHGSLVADTDGTEMSQHRMARLQTMMWVIRDPISKIVKFPDQLLSPKPLLHVAYASGLRKSVMKTAETIAYNIGPTGKGDGQGGLVIDLPCTLQNLADSRGVAIGDIKKGVDRIKRKRSDSYLRNGRASSEVEFGKPQTETPQVSKRAIGMLSWKDGGPFDMGADGDKHFIGVDHDGHPINSAHISVGALFRAGNEADGPLAFEPAIYSQPDELPEKSRVHLRWDPFAPHPWIDGPRTGAWRWEAEWSFTCTPKKPTMVVVRGKKPGSRDGETTTGRRDGETTGLHDQGWTPPKGSFWDTEGMGEINPTMVPQEAPGEEPKHCSVRTTAEFPRPVIYTRMETAFSVVMARPQRQGVGDLDFRTATSVDETEKIRNEKTTPITGRLEAWGAQGRGEGWAYTESPGILYTGGTSHGGFALLPPEMSLTNIRDESLPKSLSTTYFMSVPGTSIAWGTPTFATGLIGDGYTSYQDSDDDFQFNRVGATTIPAYKVFTDGHFRHETAIDMPIGGDTGSGPLTLDEGDHTVIIDNTGAGTYTLNLPASDASTAGRIYQIKRINAGGATRQIAVTCQPGDTIDGAGPLNIVAQYDSVTVKADGDGGWWAFGV